MPILQLPRKKILTKNSSSQPIPVQDTAQGDKCKSVRMGRLLTCLLHTVAQESCAGCERGPGGAGAQNWVNTFAGNAIVHFHLFQLPECLLFVPAKQAVAQAENPGIGCVSAANFRNGCISKAVSLGRSANHCRGVPPDFIIRCAETVVWQ